MKRSKFRKTKASSPLSGLKQTLFDKSAGIGTAVVFIVLVFILAKAFLYRSDYFRLRTIEARVVAPESALVPSIKYDQLLSLYKGRNVFSLNLKSIENFFEEVYPDAKEITANIALPDKIVVRLKCRWPAAILRGDRSYVIDNDGYLLSGVYSASSKSLIVIEGIGTGPSARAGRRFRSENLKPALELLKEIRRARFLARYGVSRINAADPANMAFYLASGVEVKIGSEDFRDRLKILEKTLRDPRLILEKIDYIDVRFKDAVIGPK